MRYGAIIEVQEAFDNQSFKRVVSVDERNVYVCTEDEFRNAEGEKREPISIGFPLQYVLRVIK